MAEQPAGVSLWRSKQLHAAVQLGAGCDWDAIAAWCGGEHDQFPFASGLTSPCIRVPGARGSLTAFEGSWIVSEPDGFAVYEPTALVLHYEPSPAPAAGLAPLRDRIDAALQASIDSCSRCKACDAQVDAVMAVVGPLLDEARESRSETPVTPVPSAAMEALTRLASEVPLTDWKPANKSAIAMDAEMEARREFEHTGYVTEVTGHGSVAAYHVDLPDKVWGGNPLAQVEYAASAYFGKLLLSEKSVRSAWEADLVRRERLKREREEWQRRADERALAAPGSAGSEPADDDEDDPDDYVAHAATCNGEWCDGQCVDTRPF
jgi:hypothetical protein